MLTERHEDITQPDSVIPDYQIAQNSNDDKIMLEGPTAYIVRTELVQEVKNDQRDFWEQQALQAGTTMAVSPEDLEAERRLLRKIDLHILPLLFCSYGIQYMDKIGLSSGVAFGLLTDTHLVGQEYAWLTTGFYLAYLAAEFPVNWLMQRYPIDRVLAYCVAWWGVCVFGLAACNNFTQLLVCRILLGMGEAAVLPGFFIILTAWYKKTEAHWRGTLFGLSSPIFAFWVLMVFYALGLHSKSVAGWRAINLFLGALSIVWSVVVWFLLRTPKNARWLTPDERKRAHARLIESQTGESESGVAIKWAEVREAFSDPMIYFSLTFVLLYCLSSGGIGTFSTLILTSFGLTGGDAIAYQIPWFVFQLIGQGGAGWICHKYQNKNVNLYCCMVCIVPALVGIFLEALLHNDQRWGRIIGFWISGLFQANFYIICAQNGLNCAGRTKKGVFQAMTFCVFSFAYMVGPQAFQAKDKPNYYPGLYFCAACYACMGIVAVVWRIYCVRENARRQRVVAASGLSPTEAELEGRLNALNGMTDRQNIHFRYRY